MTGSAARVAQRRGACPGLSAPLPTGDGLLVRLLPSGTIALTAFAELCKAARTCGNGVIEVTARGSIQVRGLSATSATQFAARVAALDIAAADGIPVHTGPLSGLDGAELLDAAALAAELRRALARRAMTARVGAKVSVAIDGGGVLGLDTLAADLRLRAATLHGTAVLDVAVGGDATGATPLGAIPLAHGVDAAMRLIDVIAQRGRDVRARDIVAAEGVAPFRAALADLAASSASPPGNKRTANAIGTHRLRDGSLACGLGLAFGHADAESLESLIDAAYSSGATGFRTSPGRVLLAIGLAAETLPPFAATAERLGFIVRADDPRRRVVACAGAPVCASAHIAARAMAPNIAALAASRDASPDTIHISGCAKGCAHPAAAALTIVGTPGGCALIRNGSVRDAPIGVVPASELPAAIAKLARRPRRESRHV